MLLYPLDSRIGDLWSETICLWFGKKPILSFNIESGALCSQYSRQSCLFSLVSDVQSKQICGIGEICITFLKNVHQC